MLDWMCCEIDDNIDDWVMLVLQQEMTKVMECSCSCCCCCVIALVDEQKMMNNTKRHSQLVALARKGVVSVVDI